MQSLHRDLQTIQSICLIPKFPENAIPVKKPTSWSANRCLVVFCMIGLFVLAWTASAPRIVSAPPGKIFGFSPRHAAEQAALEGQLKKSISTEEIRKQHRYFTSIPHPAGSVHDRCGLRLCAAQNAAAALADRSGCSARPALRGNSSRASARTSRSATPTLGRATQ